MDLSDTGEPISFQTETANSLTPVIQQSDVNINNGVYEINLATFTVDTSTISNLVNVAPFIDISPDSEFSASSNNPLMNKAITKAIGDPETIGGSASQPYTKGALLLATDGQIYEVTQNIALHGSIVNGGNVSPTGNIISQISNIATSTPVASVEVLKALNVATVRILSKSLTASSGGWKQICTIPSEYRCSKELRFVGVDKNANSRSELPILLCLKTTGSLEWYAFASGSIILDAVLTFITA